MWKLFFDLQVRIMELQGRTDPCGSLAKDIMYVSEGSYGSDNSNLLVTSNENRANSSRSLSVSLKDESSGNIRDVLVPWLQSKKIHDKAGYTNADYLKQQNRGDVVISELRPKKLNDKGGSSKFDYLKPKKCSGKSRNV